jgi:hypothetical protein
MPEGVRELGAEVGLEVGQQLELTAVEAAVVRATERHHAVRLVAAALRARHQVRRVTGRSPQTRHASPATLSRCAGEAGLKGDRRGGVRLTGGPERRRPPRRFSGACRRSPALRRTARAQRDDSMRLRLRWFACFHARARPIDRGAAIRDAAIDMHDGVRVERAAFTPAWNQRSRWAAGNNLDRVNSERLCIVARDALSRESDERGAPRRRQSGAW